MLRVSPEPPSSPVAAELLGALTRELVERYPEEDGEAAFHPDDVSIPRSVFLAAWIGDEPVGCGALRPVDATTAELKRIYVAPAARGNGVGRELLVELERHGKAFGYARFILETGVRQPEAIALYEKNGYLKTPPYGQYIGNPLSVCFAKCAR